MKKYILYTFLSVIPLLVSAQSQNVKIATVGFYNLENLFDTENDTLINDEEFLPDGAKHWTLDKYNEKLANMAYTISLIGTDIAPQGLSILGIAEIENRKVVEDLINQPLLASRKYEIIHFDSKDFRGIDVGIIYNPLHYTPDTSYIIPLVIMSNGVERYTRDILYTKGMFDGEEMVFLVNHWPSRRGGEKTSAPNRNKGAQLCRNVIDQAMEENPNAKIIVMGDLNDDPTSESVKSFLRAKGKKSDVEKGGIYNPMEDFYRRGIGSNAYQDNWSLFDQILITEPLLDNNQNGYYFYKANVFNKKFLIQPSGKYKGYPFRTFSFDVYQGGYSDHFPVYIAIVKNVD
jgi:predicted extracellular nuclease